MSQQKVEQYKKDKANRKKILAREKFRTRVAGCAVGIVCLAIVGYIGYSVYDYVESNKATVYTQVNVDAISDYESSIY